MPDVALCENAFKIKRIGRINMDLKQCSDEELIVHTAIGDTDAMGFYI